MRTRTLYKVTINLNYLYYTDKEEMYDTGDVLKWFLNDCHEGELEQDGVCEILEITDPSEVEEFGGGYPVYNDLGEEIDLDEICKSFQTPEAMVYRLEKLGYKITPPASKKPAAKKPSRKK